MMSRLSRAGNDMRETSPMQRALQALVWITLILFALLWVMTQKGFSQTSQPTQIVKKQVGENTTFLWDYLVTDEPLITNFSLGLVDDLTKTTIEIRQIPANLRTVSLPASYNGTFKFMYYNVRAVKQNPDPVPDEVSAPSNTVATERVGRPPTNLRGQYGG